MDIQVITDSWRSRQFMLQSVASHIRWLVASGRRTIILGLIIFTWHCTWIPALNPEKSISQYVIKTWKVQDGLPSHEIRAIAQTSDHYLWLATDIGLVQFDGVRFFTYNRTNTPALYDNIIVDLAVSGPRLWIGTRTGGIAYREDQRILPLELEDILSTRNLECLYVDRERRFWAGTSYQGLVRILGHESDAFSEASGLIHHTVLSIHQDTNGHLRVGTRLGLAYFRDGMFQTYLNENLRNRSILSITEDRNGALWLGTESGLFRMTADEVRYFGPAVGIAVGAVNCVLEDHHGNMWAGGTTGLIRIGPLGTEVFGADDGLLGQTVLSLYEDGDNSLWVGTSSGLNQLRDGPVTTYPAGIFSSTPVSTICQDPSGQIWLGGDSGLIRMTDGQSSPVPWPEGQGFGRVRSILPTLSGSLLVGTEKTGLFQLKDNRLENDPLFNSFADSSILSMLSLPDGTIWFGTRQGLHHYDGERLASFWISSDPAQNIVRAIEPRGKTDLWLGTENGLLLLRNEALVNENQGFGLPPCPVYDLYTDSHDRLWIATYGQGLGLLRENKVIMFTTRNGLASDYLCQILADDAGDLWLGSSRGVFRIRYTEGDRGSVGLHPADWPVSGNRRRLEE